MKTESAKESNEDNGKYQRRERFIGRIHCILTLPGTANATKMTTDYESGVDLHDSGAICLSCACSHVETWER